MDALLGYALEHGLAAEGTGGGVGGRAALRAGSQTLGGEALGEAAILAERREQVLDLAAQHLHQPVGEHQQAVGRHEGVVRAEPRVELMLLLQDVPAALVEHVVAVGGRIELDGVDGAVLVRARRPGEAVVPQQPVQVVVGQFGQAGTRHVRQLHLRLSRRGMSGIALGDVGRSRPRRLRHLVVLPSARVVRPVQVARAELLRRQLDDVRQHPRVQPIITEIPDFHRH